jgi:hypothetical protein
MPLFYDISVQAVAVGSEVFLYDVPLPLDSREPRSVDIINTETAEWREERPYQYVARTDVVLANGKGLYFVAREGIHAHTFGDQPTWKTIFSNLADLILRPIYIFLLE